MGLTSIQPYLAAVGVLSLLGALSVIVTFLRYPQLRRSLTHPVFYMSICDFLFCAKWTFPALTGQLFAEDATTAGSHAMLCNLEAIVGAFGATGTVLWYGAICMQTNRIILGREPYPFALYHTVIWVYCAGSVLAAFAFQGFAPTGDGACWIRDDDTAGDLWRLTFYGPLFLCMGGAVLVLWRRTQTVLRGNKLLSTKRSTLRSRMTVFIGTFVVVWAGPVVLRVLQIFSSDVPFGFVAWHLFSCQIGPLANAVVWLSAKPVYRLLPCYKWQRRHARKSEGLAAPLLGGGGVDAGGASGFDGAAYTDDDEDEDGYDYEADDEEALYRPGSVDGVRLSVVGGLQ